MFAFVEVDYVFRPGGFTISIRFTLLMLALQWRHDGRDSVSNHQPHDCLLKSLFGRRSKKTSKLRVTGLCAGNSPVTGEFRAQVASNAENISIRWRHHASYWRWCRTTQCVYIDWFIGSISFVWPLCGELGPVNSPHKGPVARKMLPFDDVIMVHNDCPSVSITILNDVNKCTASIQ